MPDPRLSTVEENDFTDIETTADAWHLPPSYFSIPTSPTSITSPTSPILGRPPSSPYDCHFHSPLATSFAEDPNGKKIPSIEGNLKCDSPCNEGIACRFHNPEHPFHHRQKSSVPRGVWTPIVDVKEILAAEGEKKSPTPTLWPHSTVPLLSSPHPHLHPLHGTTTAPDPEPQSNSPNTTTPTDAPPANPPTDAAALAAATREKQRRAQWAEAILQADPQSTELLYSPAWKAETAGAWLPLL